MSQSNVAESDAGDEAEEAPGRVSRIVEIVEREASPVTGAEEPKKHRDDEFEVDADLDEKQVKAARDAQLPRPQTQASDSANAEEIIEVTDAEIEPLPARTTQPSPAASAPTSSPRVSAAPPPQRSRPPERPSVRPRGSFPPGGLPPIQGGAGPSTPGSLPPPRGSSPGFPSPFASTPPSAAPGSSHPSGQSQSSVDPWLLANRTLELSRAQARIAELEEFIAFRDARIVALESQLAEAESKLSELEQRLGPRSEGARARSASLAAPREAAKQPQPNVPSLESAAAKPAATRPPGGDAPKPAESPKAAARSREPEPSGLEKPSEVTVVRPVTPSQASPAPTARSMPAPAPARASVAAAPVPAAATVAAPPAAAAPLSAADSTSPADAELDDSADSLIPDSMPAPSAQPVQGSTSTRGGDDLRSIAGIGPRFEAALRKQGITRLAQIAAWSEDDVRQVAKALKIPKSRIVKGRWVESAREAIGTRAASE